jgi:SAM-dependent methyltransferase
VIASKPFLLRGPYRPSHAENRMQGEGDVAAARDDFFARKPSNLAFLLEQRYGWMNPYVQGLETVVEVGSGPGFAREFIRHPHLLMTDVQARPWIDREVDALAPPFGDGSVDAVISCHMIHHLAQPQAFFAAMRRILRPGGYLIISEINTSLLMRILLRAMRHEGWSYEIDVFEPSIPANDPSDPWSANCAIPMLLFGDERRFCANVPGFSILRNELHECFIFPLSGGVVSKTATVNLPRAALRAVALLDRLLIATLPSVFALGRRVVLQKTT